MTNYFCFSWLSTLALLASRRCLIPHNLFFSCFCGFVSSFLRLSDRVTKSLYLLVFMYCFYLCMYLFVYCFYLCIYLFVYLFIHICYLSFLPFLPMSVSSHALMTTFTPQFFSIIVVSVLPYCPLYIRGFFNFHYDFCVLFSSLSFVLSIIPQSSPLCLYRLSLICVIIIIIIPSSSLSSFPLHHHSLVSIILLLSPSPFISLHHHSLISIKILSSSPSFPHLHHHSYVSILIPFSSLSLPPHYFFLTSTPSSFLLPH